MLNAQYPTNLESMFASSSPLLADMAMRQFNTAQANEGQNMSLAKQLYDQSQELHPLELQNKNLANLTSQAQLPGLQADSASKVLKADREIQTQGDAISQLKAKLKSEASDSDLKILTNLGTTLSQVGAAGAQNGAIPLSMMQSLPKEFHQFASNPSKLKELGDAMLAASSERQSEMAKLAAQRQTSVDVANIQSKTQKDLEEARINAGKYANHTSQFQILQALAKGPDQAAVIYAQLAEEAAQAAQQAPANSPERQQLLYQANTYSQMAEQNKQQSLAKAAAAANEANRGKPDLQGFDIKPVNPNPSVVTPPGQPSAPQQTGQYTTGQTYTGKTGTYKYNGGDPKDPKNWTKVK